MLKVPVAGRVKTRLGREVGMPEAAWWFRHQVRRLLRRLRDPRWDIVLAIAPDPARLSCVFPLDFGRIGQGRGDLGARMARVLREIPQRPLLIIGGDIPGVTPGRIAEAFQALGGRDAVFGPAEDGGYWLVGLGPGAVPTGLFQGVRWSTRHALRDSIAALPGRQIAQAATLRDVDTAADLSA